MEFELIFLLFACSLSSTKSVFLANETDIYALIEFKNHISDPLGSLSSWNDTTHFCQWTGISCGYKHQRVTTLDLSSKNLAGSLSPCIANLTFLVTFILSTNQFSGKIPPEIGNLGKLQLLDLSYNSFIGGISANLSFCSNLRSLYLISNYLTGEIPESLGSLPKLGYLSLSNNSLVGVIPSSLANISSLTHLFLRTNHLEGSIPGKLGDLSKLETLQLSDNNLSGVVPSSIFNLSSMNYFGLAANMVQGSFPSNFGTRLHNLQTLLLGGNQFTGSIPSSLPNASGLSFLDISSNEFSGQIPPDLGKLVNLSQLNLQKNQFESSDIAGWEFLTSLANCSELQLLILFDNNLSGDLPSSVANLSTQIRELRMGVNQISGSIPPGIENLVNLNAMTMEQNFLTGIIPQGIGKLKRLQQLNLYHNRLVGEIPSSIGNNTQLTDLLLSYNNLTGPIPSSLGNLKNLNLAGLGKNRLNGTLPKDIFTLPSMYVLSLSSNQLVGSLPPEIGSMENLNSLYIAGNKLSGEIPSSLSECVALETLDMSQNSFQGSIPSSFGSMKGLQQLNLGGNNLSGPIPSSLQNLSLVYLNLSFNHLDGNVPIDGVFKNATATNLVGNRGLCGGIPEFKLPECPVKSSQKGRQMSSLLKIVISIVGATLFLAFILFIVISYWKRNSKKESPSTPSFENRHHKVSYVELAKATDGFSSANLIGTGGFGSVYKGSLDNGDTTVAIKVFKLWEKGASKSFVAECDTLRCIRHRNLVKILTSCSSVDLKGDDFKALVFEFMPNESLEEWLHGEGGSDHQSKNLKLLQRLNIATEVADALDYLHHDCETPIVHCDLKPSNVLLDGNMIARLGDFGLAKLLPDSVSMSLQDPSSGIGLRGSIGYIPPEYGVAAWQVSQLLLGMSTALGSFCWRCLPDYDLLMICLRMG